MQWHVKGIGSISLPSAANFTRAHLASSLSHWSQQKSNPCKNSLHLQHLPLIVLLGFSPTKVSHHFPQRPWLHQHTKPLNAAMTLQTGNPIVRSSNLSSVKGSHNRFLVPFVRFSSYTVEYIVSFKTISSKKTSLHTIFIPFRVIWKQGLLSIISVRLVSNVTLKLTQYLLFLQHHVAVNQC